MAWELARPARLPLTCLAEGLAAWALITEATAILAEQGVAADVDLLIDHLFDNTDFLVLFDPALDSLADAAGAFLGMDSLDRRDWFVPFGGGTRGAASIPTSNLTTTPHPRKTERHRRWHRERHRHPRPSAGERRDDDQQA